MATDRVGKYELLAQLTAGGMAELFLGCTRGPGGFRKYVVIKRILPDAAKDENFVKMFLDEARITAGFNHPNIAQVYDLGEDPEGLYVVMEFIAGRNLHEMVVGCAEGQAMIPIGYSLSVVHDCALALHSAHTYRTPSGESVPVIHRDVAQKNIMVAYDGQVKLLDFGIAKAKNSLSRTSVGAVKGTTGYMSPEQVRGEPLDGRSDLFSLGVVAWEMVTGRRLFSAQTEIAEMKLILEAPIEPPHLVEPSVPEALSLVIMKALERNRGTRFVHARDFARALDREGEELLFDADGRAQFMRELFGERIAETRALFDAADSHPEKLQLAVEAFRHGSAAPSAQAAATPKETPAKKKSRPAQSGARLTKQREQVATEVDPAVEARLQAVRLEAEVMGAVRSTSVVGRTWSGPLIAALVGAAFLLVGWKLMVHDRRPDGHGLQHFPGETASDEDAPPTRVDAIPGVDTTHRAPPAPPPEPLAPRNDVVNAATPPITLPPEALKPAPTPKVLPRPTPAPEAAKGPGEVTLGLLPSGAVVYEGSVELGRGTVVTLTLPSGNHTLTVVGKDRVRRALSVPVVAGRVKSLKLDITELPPTE
jgi:serine/threonine-protein kinase